MDQSLSVNPNLQQVQIPKLELRIAQIQEQIFENIPLVYQSEVPFKVQNLTGEQMNSLKEISKKRIEIYKVMRERKVKDLMNLKEDIDDLNKRLSTLINEHIVMVKYMNLEGFSLRKWYWQPPHIDTEAQYTHTLFSKTLDGKERFQLEYVEAG